MITTYLVLASDVSDEVRLLRLVPVVQQLVNLKCYSSGGGWRKIRLSKLVGLSEI